MVPGGPWDERPVNGLAQEPLAAGPGPKWSPSCMQSFLCYFVVVELFNVSYDGVGAPHMTPIWIHGQSMVSLTRPLVNMSIRS